MRSTTGKLAQLEAQIFSASAAGLGLELGQPTAPDVIRGASVRVAFAAGNDHLEMPARVAWRATGDCGVRLLLEIAGTATRREYERWLAKIDDQNVTQS